MNHEQKPISYGVPHRSENRYKLPILILGIISGILTALPINAAERIYFHYGPLAFSVSVDTLETFAQEGTIEPELAFYLNRVSKEDQTKFRDFLKSDFNFNYLVLHRFFHSPTGEMLLTYMGELIQIQGGRNGFYGIRASVVQAAADPEGLTPINIMRKFPTNIELNTGRILQFMEQISTLNQETKGLVTALKERTTKTAASEPEINFDKLPDLHATGKFNFSKQTITIRDQNRKREFPIDLYLPEKSNQSQIPVIVFSNGFGVPRQQGNNTIAEHLASYGFAVIIPDHPGSDRQQQENFLSGLSKEAFKATAFINRPLDVTYLLDELERLNQSEFKGQLNLEQVGIFGHSAGGSTALSLAGAKINFKQLKKDCSSQENLINPSLLFQCRALELPQQNYNLQDSRIKAIFNFLPFSSSLFGQEGMSQINIPTFLIAFSEDIFTPVLLEQIPSFGWLITSDKYLGVIEGLQHVNFDLSELQGVKLLNEDNLDKLTDEFPSAFQDYPKVLSLAFFKVYVVGDSDYRHYLQASYAQAISENPYNLSFVQSLD